MKTIDINEAKNLATQAGPNIDNRFDMTRNPSFPAGRTDVAVVQRDAEDGSSYGRTKWYVVYNYGDGTKIKTLYDTGKTHDNCHMSSVTVVEGVLYVEVRYGEIRKILKQPLSDLKLPKNI